MDYSLFRRVEKLMKKYNCGNVEKLNELLVMNKDLWDKYADDFDLWDEIESALDELEERELDRLDDADIDEEDEDEMVSLNRNSRNSNTNMDVMRSAIEERDRTNSYYGRDSYGYFYDEESLYDSDSRYSDDDF